MSPYRWDFRRRDSPKGISRKRFRRPSFMCVNTSRATGRVRHATRMNRMSGRSSRPMTQFSIR